MATITQPPATETAAADRHTPDHGGRAARWRASWRVSLRMAWRDTLAHKGRSALVFVMVAIPVGLLVGIALTAVTSQADVERSLPRTLGSAQALIQSPQPQPVFQEFSGDSWSTGGSGEFVDNAEPAEGPAAQAIPGYDPEASGVDNAKAISDLVGAPVVATGTGDTRLRLDDDRSRSMTAMVLTDPEGLGSKAELRSGRWPRAEGEIVVTPYGVDRGLPSSGTVTLQQGDESLTRTVVGVATAYTSDSPSFVSMPELVTTSAWDGLEIGQWNWLVTGDAPVTWDKIKQLNPYGLVVTSAEVVRNTPPDSELYPEVAGSFSSGQSEVALLTAIGGVMLFAITVLLVAPAFAVSASRQRRTLALAASNGAEVRQLRRSVLAQALVLGVLSTLIVTVLTIGGFWLFMVWHNARVPWSYFWAFTVPVLPVVIIVACALVSVVVAALLPASRLGRLDIIGVMRGQSVSPSLNKVLPVVGILMAAAGAAGIVWSVATAQREIPIVASGILLVLGPILTVPALLVLAGKLASHLPVTARMATRDAARHRSRATPTVAAVMGGAAALTIFAIGLASDTEQARRDYTAQLPAGLGQYTAYGMDGPAPDVVKQAETDLQAAGTTDLVAFPIERLGDAAAQNYGGVDPAQQPPIPFVIARPEGCTTAQALNEMPETDPNGNQAPARCAVTGPIAYNNISGVAAVPLADLRVSYGLSEDQLRTLADGGVVSLIDRLGSETTLVSGTMDFGQDGFTPSLVSTAKEVTVPVAQMPLSRNTIGALGSGVGAVMTLETADELGLPHYSESAGLRTKDGTPVSQSDQDRLTEVVDGGQGYVYVERGFERYDRVIMAFLFGGFALLLLVVTLISTALSLAEQQTDMGTFAAVGATKSTRRRLAAAQSAVVATIGVVLGIVIGYFPGWALTYPLTSDTWDPISGSVTQGGSDNILVVPWLPLAAVVIGVPVVAALLSAAAVRRAPTVTRRAE